MPAVPTSVPARRRLPAALAPAGARCWGWTALERATVHQFFASDGLEPSQVPDPHTQSPEVRLLWAILIEAIVCLMPHGIRRGRDRPRHTQAAQQEAWAWIDSDARWYFTAFANICEALGQDPGRMRQALHATFDQPGEPHGMVSPLAAQARRAVAGASTSPRP